MPTIRAFNAAVRANNLVIWTDPETDGGGMDFFVAEGPGSRRARHPLLLTTMLVTPSETKNKTAIFEQRDGIRHVRQIRRFRPPKGRSERTKLRNPEQCPNRTLLQNPQFPSIETPTGAAKTAKFEDVGKLPTSPESAVSRPSKCRPEAAKGGDLISWSSCPNWTPRRGRNPSNGQFAQN
jgi:hypothetical protein